MTVLVTGGAGFIGSHLCDDLIEDDYTVVCLDNLGSGRQSNVSHLMDDDRFTLVKGDVREPLASQLVDAGVEPVTVEYVYHLASRASPADYQEHPVATAAANGIGTFNTLEFATDVDARLLFASTSEVYGDPEVHPQPETYNGNVNIRGPRACYDESKRYGETLQVAFHEEYGLDTRTARIFNTYGPRMRPDDGRVISNFLRQALAGQDLTVYGDGSQTRSFLYVSDQIRGLRRLMERPGLAGEVVNIGSTDEITIQELAETVIEVTDADVGISYEPLPEDDPQRRRPDISRAKGLLDWEPAVGLRQGLEKIETKFERK